MRTKISRREGSIRVLYQLPHPVSKVHTSTGMILCVSNRLASVVSCSKRENALRASRIRMRFDWYRLILGVCRRFNLLNHIVHIKKFHTNPRGNGIVNRIICPPAIHFKRVAAEPVLESHTIQRHPTVQPENDPDLQRESMGDEACHC